MPGPRVWSFSSFLQGLAAAAAVFVFITGVSSIPEIQKLFAHTRVTLYDDFDDPRYDGSFSTELWEFSGSPGAEVWQDAGILVLDLSGQQMEGNVALHATRESNPLTQFQAKLRLESERRGQGGFIKVQVVYVTASSWSWIECQISNDSYTSASYSCNYTDETNWQEYNYLCETEKIFLPYDSWHVVRYAIDSSGSIIRFFLNEKYIGNCPIADPSSFDSLETHLQIGTWAGEGDRLIGYFDEVSFGK